jgi:hypothetical protein
MKALKIIVISIVALIVAGVALQKQISSVFLYSLAVKGREKRPNVIATKADILGSVAEMKVGPLVKCNKYLSVKMPESFTAELSKEDKKISTTAKLDLCVLKSIKEKGRYIYITDQTNTFRVPVESMIAFFKKSEALKLSFRDEILADINKSSRLFDRSLVLRESARKPLHFFAFEENVYANLANINHPVYSFSTYQEVGDYIVAVVDKARQRYLVFTPDNKSLMFQFSQFKDDEILAYLKSVMKKNALVVDEKKYQEANKEFNQTSDNDLREFQK